MKTPMANPANRKNCIVHVRLTEGEKNILSQISAKRGIKVSDVIRECLRTIISDYQKREGGPG